MTVKAIILSAGKGTRLKPITENVPKVIIEVKGKPCLQHNIEALKNHGITDIAINTHYLPEKIKELFGDGSNLGVKLNYSYEPELLGTSGALNNFREFFDDTFIVIYGDVLHEINLTEMLDFHKKNNSFCTLAVDDRVFKSGAAIVEGEKVVNFVEKPEQDLENAFANSGIIIFEPGVLDYIPEGFSDFGFNILPDLLKNKKQMYAFKTTNVNDIGSFEVLDKFR